MALRKEVPAKPEAILRVLYCTGCGDALLLCPGASTERLVQELSGFVVRVGLVEHPLREADRRGPYGYAFCPTMRIERARDPVHTPRRWRKLASAFYERPAGSRGSKARPIRLEIDRMTAIAVMEALAECTCEGLSAKDIERHCPEVWGEGWKEKRTKAISAADRIASLALNAALNASVPA